MDSPLLELRSVRRTFRGADGKDERVLRSVSFAVEPGELVGIMGVSGVGKSTLARIVCGIDRDYQGEILDFGVPRQPGRRPRHIQFVTQEVLQALNPRLTVGGLLSEALAGRPRFLAGRAQDARWGGLQFLRRWRRFRRGNAILSEAMERVRLDSSFLSRRSSQLSGGQRQRVLVARALLANPSLLVLDEPVASQDSSIKARISNLLGDIHRTSGTTMVLISHDRGVLEYLCDRILDLKEGYI